jgi:transcriptional regulator with XRE-family HTH domain
MISYKNDYSLRLNLTSVILTAFGRRSMVMHDRLRAIRKELNLNQASFAEKIGLNQNSLSMIEKKHTPITDKNVKLICATFNVNEQWLRRGLGEMFCASPYEKELKDICASLSPDNQQSLLIIAKELLKIQNRTNAEKN